MELELDEWPIAKQLYKPISILEGLQLVLLEVLLILTRLKSLHTRILLEHEQHEVA